MNPDAILRALPGLDRARLMAALANPEARLGRFVLLHRLEPAGRDGGGKGETVSLLNAWMDPRWLITRAYDAPSEDEREHPEFWRYWRDLPPRGHLGMFLSAWYSKPVLDHVPASGS